jgi:hypothetical protein
VEQGNISDAKWLIVCVIMITFMIMRTAETWYVVINRTECHEFERLLLEFRTDDEIKLN